MENFAVILAGGRGERFWPISRSGRPKQLIRLLSDKTMLEDTLDRVKSIVADENVVIITGNEIKEMIEECVPGLTEENFLLEPIGRNTAPAIGLAAAKIIATKGDGIMFVLSSDHRINPVATFVDALNAAKSMVEKEGSLVLLGIEPNRPETGYGYIEVGEIKTEIDGFVMADVAVFKEKPNRILAQEYYLDGKHLWNSGIFVWKATKIMEEIGNFLPDLHNELQKYIEVYGTDKENDVLKEAFNRIEPISIDYGVLEKSDSVTVLRANFTWDDVGNYAALERVLERDREGNVVVGDDVKLFDTYETTIMNDMPGMVVVFGVSDLVIVRSGDVLFVLQKTRIPEMRELLEHLKRDPDIERYL